MPACWAMSVFSFLLAACNRVAVVAVVVVVVAVVAVVAAVVVVVVVVGGSDRQQPQHWPREV